MLSACAEARSRSSTAPSDDLEDYRSYLRRGGVEGTRLKRAQRYLEKHPNGAWSTEVRAAFDEEEPRFYEKAQSSHEGIRRYLADLPQGVHTPTPRSIFIVALGSSRAPRRRSEAPRSCAPRALERRREARKRAAVQRRAVRRGDTLGALGQCPATRTSTASRGPRLRRSSARSCSDATPRPGAASPPPARTTISSSLPTRPRPRRSRLITLESHARQGQMASSSPRAWKEGT